MYVRPRVRSNPSTQLRLLVTHQGVHCARGGCGVIRPGCTSDRQVQLLCLPVVSCRSLHTEHTHLCTGHHRLGWQSGRAVRLYPSPWLIVRLADGWYRFVFNLFCEKKYHYLLLINYVDLLKKSICILIERRSSSAGGADCATCVEVKSVMTGCHSFLPIQRLTKQSNSRMRQRILL
jgi:hypothetical protein